MLLIASSSAAEVVGRFVEVKGLEAPDAWTQAFVRKWSSGGGVLGFLRGGEPITEGDLVEYTVEEYKGRAKAVDVHKIDARPARPPAARAAAPGAPARSPARAAAPRPKAPAASLAVRPWGAVDAALNPPAPAPPAPAPAAPAAKSSGWGAVDGAKPSWAAAAAAGGR